MRDKIFTISLFMVLLLLTKMSYSEHLEVTLFIGLFRITLAMVWGILTIYGIYAIIKKTEDEE